MVQDTRRVRCARYCLHTDTQWRGRSTSMQAQGGRRWQRRHGAGVGTASSLAARMLRARLGLESRAGRERSSTIWKRLLSDYLADELTRQFYPHFSEANGQTQGMAYRRT